MRAIFRGLLNLSRLAVVICGLAYIVNAVHGWYEQREHSQAQTAFNQAYVAYIDFLFQEVAPQTLRNSPQREEPPCYGWTPEEHALTQRMVEHLEQLHLSSLRVLALELKQRDSSLGSIVYYTNVRDSSFQFSILLRFGLETFTPETERQFCLDAPPPGVPI